MGTSPNADGAKYATLSLADRPSHEAPILTLLRGRICARCVYDELTPGISFDAGGICNYCRLHDAMERQYPTGAEGERALQRIVARIRQAGRGKKYDCVVGVSGGCDSSYMLYKMVDYGLRPLAVHFDNTWNSPIATTNIYNVLEKLGVELDTYVVNNREYDDIYRAFMLAGVKDVEAPTDIGLAATLYRSAERHGVKYIIEGHTFRTEGIAPLGWIYMDGRYIESVHRAFGTRPMETFPNLSLKDFLRWAAVRNIRRIRPLYHLDYRKDDAKQFLTNELNWEWYGGHHLENRFTAFYHSYFIPRRWGLDFRINGYAGLVRSGQMTREEGLVLLAEAPYLEPDLLQYVKKRLGYSDGEFERVMTLPKQTFRDYETYKKTFERLKPLFRILAERDLVPKTFYLKFTEPDQAPKAVAAERHTAPIATSN